MAFINISVEGSVKVVIFTSEFLMGKLLFKKKSRFPSSSNFLSPNSVKPTQSAKNYCTFCHPQRM